MTNLREELDRLHAAATPGKRRASPGGSADPSAHVWSIQVGVGGAARLTRAVAKYDPRNGAADAAWDAAAHNAWPAISARLAALEAVAEAADGLVAVSRYVGHEDLVETRVDALDVALAALAALEGQDG